MPSPSGMSCGRAHTACLNGIVCLPVRLQEMGEIAPIGSCSSSANMPSSSGQEGLEMRAGAEGEGPIIAAAKQAGH